MPVHETEDGYQYGKTGKVYKSKKKAIKQALAIAYSKARKKGRKPTQDEIETEISGNPDEEHMDKVASALRKLAAAYGLLPKEAAEFPNMPAPPGGWTGPGAVPNYLNKPKPAPKPTAKPQPRPQPKPKKEAPSADDGALEINEGPGGILERVKKPNGALGPYKK
jgi:hypothetical protein